MKFVLKILREVTLLALCVLAPATAAIGATDAAPVAVFPLQDISQGRNGLNIPFTRYLTERLAASGTETSSFETVLAFMSNNRIRIAGQLETYHLTRIREELGVAFVLLGTVLQNKDRPTPSLGVSLNLVRTSDARTIWSYVGAVSGAEHRKLLGIGEAKSAKELEPILGDDILTLWPGDVLIPEQQRSVSIDSFILYPRVVPPGAEVHCSVHIRNLWLANRAPRVFMKADDQIYAATLYPGSNTYEATWIAGDVDGRYPVTMVLEWPHYGRTETAQLGYYLVDGVPPLIAVDLKGEVMAGDPPIFRDEVIVMPRKVIRKPIVRWYISIRDTDDLIVADQKGTGELPEVLIWRGRNVFLERMEAAGIYKVHLDVWDEAGNTASAANRFELNRKSPVVEVTAEKKGRDVKVELTHGSKVPLAFWRLEMWSKEGKLLKTAEGEDLPVELGVELPTAEEDQDLEGTLLVQDVLGNKALKKFNNLLLPPEPEKSVEIIEEKTATKAWVEEF
jgi:TolB-like protein